MASESTLTAQSAVSRETIDGDQVDSSASDPAQTPVRVSIVVPVYRGEQSLPALLAEILPAARSASTPSGLPYRVIEVILVHDCGPDRSDLTIEALAAKHDFVRPIWLSRNFGQHAATLAGMAGAAGDWIVTMDEDGQHDPAFIGTMLDTAEAGAHRVVYASPMNRPPHGFVRNLASRAAKRVAASFIGEREFGQFNSFRLVDGEIARTLAAYCGHGVYLDIALYWITSRIGHCPVRLRMEADRPSGYSYVRLLGHFWRLVFTTGTRPLRVITVAGFLSVVLALVLSLWVVYAKFTEGIAVQGWASLLIIVATFSGCILVALGVIAEYLAVTMGIAMGKPLFVVSTRPTRPPPTR
jgi:undecaprenyl-phosphate 4-deoxy-4-formamido-L-arabinose transferase